MSGSGSQMISKAPTSVAIAAMAALSCLPVAALAGGAADWNATAEAAPATGGPAPAAEQQAPAATGQAAPAAEPRAKKHKKGAKADKDQPATGGAPSAQGPTVATDKSTACVVLSSMLQKQLGTARVLKKSMNDRSKAAPESVVEAFQEWGGGSYETDAERKKKSEMQRRKDEIVQLHNRYRAQGCGAIDIEQELARDPGKGDTHPILTEAKKKKKKKGDGSGSLDMKPTRYNY
jgi:hypothetical protein